MEPLSGGLKRRLTIARSLIFTKFFEPVFYLFGIGLGIGALVSSVDGISYVSFVALHRLERA